MSEPGVGGKGETSSNQEQCTGGEVDGTEHTGMRPPNLRGIGLKARGRLQQAVWPRDSERDRANIQHLPYPSYVTLRFPFCGTE